MPPNPTQLNRRGTDGREWSDGDKRKRTCYRGKQRDRWAIAIEIADRGFNTIATMRDPQAGSGLPAETRGRLTIKKLDVTDPGDFTFPDDLRVLVNNAGIDTEYVPVEHSDLADWRSIFETNVVAVVGMTKAAIPVLRENPPSVICNITSSSIFAAVPHSAYRASKAAVSAFNDSLRVEVAKFGIRLVEILPAQSTLTCSG